MFHADFWEKNYAACSINCGLADEDLVARICLCCLTAAAVLILSGCSESQTTSAANNERQAPITVSVILEPAYQPQLIQAAGSVAASARIEAACRLAAYIEDIPVKEGIYSKGDVLLSLTPKMCLLRFTPQTAS